MNALSLPSIPNARLPEVYMAAQTALSNCQQIDECKDWADKAAALASYAKQSQDESLMIMAQRIKARAVRRAGELLQQIEPGQGARDGKRGEGDHTPLRSDAARDAGFSKHQQVQATRIAAIPDRDFEEQVEAPKPPTLSQLAQQGIKPKPQPVIDLKGRDPREFNRALHFIAIFEDYARELDRADVGAGVAALIDSERARLRGFINRIDTIHDQIMTRI
jgi:hypothetical protein